MHIDLEMFCLELLHHITSCVRSTKTTRISVRIYTAFNKNSLFVGGNATDYCRIRIGLYVCEQTILSLFGYPL